ncbi:MAG TPA: VIT1/CCC1 family protein [Bacillota bacterium]|nr:VIT1/CCC1 family protein [Bacillota bacterium]
MSKQTIVTNAADVARFRENLQAEYDAIALYSQLAKAEPNADLAKVYQRLAETERRHADVWADKLRQVGQPVPPMRPSWRSRTLSWLAARFGTAMVLPTISGIEQGASSGYDHQADAVALGMPGDERSHARVFRYLSRVTPGMEGSAIARFEGRHRATGGNALRAGVLGANDGLLSMFSLIMGVAGANRSPGEILLTGVAGLLAGALSMALGEWISVQSSREMYQHQLKIEQNELSANPEAEAEELALIYQAKGLAPEEARRLASRLITDPVTALDTLAREELNIDPQELGGSAWEAALMSFGLFAVGGILPVLPYLFWHGTAGIIASALASAFGLFVIGAFITLMTGRNPVVSGLRQILFGLMAAAVTFGIGRLIGVSLG